jgi:hypothetical protein
MKRLLTFLLLLIASLSYGQTCDCDSLFLQTQKIVEDNYAGWFDKVTSNNTRTYNEWTEKQYALSKNIKTDSICAKQLQDWISYFKDKHLRVKFTKPKVVQNTKTENKEIPILTTNLTESQIMKYFSTSKKLDPIEGIYESPSYKLGITKIKQNLFYATIITTSNENWKSGEVKLVIKKDGTKYEGTFYEGDKSDISTNPVNIIDNILDFDIVFYEKVFPTVKTKKDIVEYEMSKDKRYAPSLIFKDNIAIWKFPSFENNAYEQTTYLLKKYEKKLETTANWVLDLSNNSGGDYSIGLLLLNYIYTKPIVFYNAEMRMTKSNYDIWYNSFISNHYNSLDSIGKNKLDERLNKMKANYDKMYNEDGQITDTLKMESAKTFPKKIALLINRNTVSSGELFTMIARQSDKVIVLGENSGGMMDYGNIVNYRTMCPTIRVQLPTNRQLWLDKGISVDKEGLQPDIYLTGKDWTAQAIKIIKE